MLSPPVLEDLARALTRVDVSPGETLTREGEPGHDYFLVAEGELEVSIGGSYVRALGPAAGFGEIALLRDGLRTATVTATSEATLYSLARAPFLEAVTGSSHAHRAARELVSERLSLPNPPGSDSPPGLIDV
jgi:CRP-like cAMP-binding protein